MQNFVSHDDSESKGIRSLENGDFDFSVAMTGTASVRVHSFDIAQKIQGYVKVRRM
jgi:hypothetical protein